MSSLFFLHIWSLLQFSAIWVLLMLIPRYCKWLCVSTLKPHSLDLASAAHSIYAWDLSYNFCLLWLTLLDVWYLLWILWKLYFLNTSHFTQAIYFFRDFTLGSFHAHSLVLSYHALLSILAKAGYPRNAPPLDHFYHLLRMSTLAKELKLESKSESSSVDILYQITIHFYYSCTL